MSRHQRVCQTCPNTFTALTGHRKLCEPCRLAKRRANGTESNYRRYYKSGETIAQVEAMFARLAAQSTTRKWSPR